MPRLAAITYEGLPIASGSAHKLRTRGLSVNKKLVLVRVTWWIVLVFLDKRNDPRSSEILPTKTINVISATRQIIAAYPQARVMIVTNYDDAGLREAARPAGACEYVVKQNLIEIRRILCAGK